MREGRSEGGGGAAGRVILTWEQVKERRGAEETAALYYTVRETRRKFPCKQLQLVQEQTVRGGAAGGGATDMKGWAKSRGLKLEGKHGKMEVYCTKLRNQQRGEAVSRQKETSIREHAGDPLSDSKDLHHTDTFTQN